MCFTCSGMWPWGHAVHVADAPTKDEYIFLDKNHSFYKDHRKVSQPPVFCRTCPTASCSKPIESSSSLPAQFTPSSSLTQPTTNTVTSSSSSLFCSKMPPTYYKYGDPYPSTLNTPGPPPAFEWENTNDWPKVYTYVPPNRAFQGYHPPAPVYYSNQPGMPQYYHHPTQVSPTCAFDCEQ